MTVEDKRKELREICKQNRCSQCPLDIWCVRVGHSPAWMDSRDVEIIFKKLKGDKTMEERTITITTHEYKGLVADQAILAKLEVYTETHEFLNDDFIRTLLGTKKPNPARIESEGD